MRSSKKSIAFLTESGEDKLLDTFKGVFLQYYSALCFFADKLINDRPTAEDIVEDVFIRLWTKEKDFSNYRSVKAVLYVSVKNACLNLIKARRLERLKLGQLDYLLKQESENFILNEMTRAEVLREVYAEMQKLPRECRRVMELFFVEGWDYKKISSHLDITVSTVKNHKSRGLRILKRKLGGALLLAFIIYHS